VGLGLGGEGGEQEDEQKRESEVALSSPRSQDRDIHPAHEGLSAETPDLRRMALRRFERARL